MTATVFYVGGAEFATLTNTFSVNGTPTDPTTVSLIVTDPALTSVTYTYSPGTITRLGTGQYRLLVACNTVDGLWQYEWIGTRAASDVTVGTWRVFPTTMGNQYTSKEEVKDRLQISDANEDFRVTAAVQAASRWVERHCGRHFYQVVATRTYVPYSIYELPIDDLVSISALNLDFSGSGVFDTSWSPGQYQLVIGPTEFNIAAGGEPVPWTLIRVTQNSGFFPFVWPFAPINRVQVAGTWGWPAVPADVAEATLMVATDLFKLKDAPFGLAGVGEYGIIRVKGASPVVLEMLMPYRSPRRKVGM